MPLTSLNNKLASTCAPWWTYLGRGLWFAQLIFVITPVPFLGSAFPTDSSLIALRLGLFIAMAVAASLWVALRHYISPARTHRTLLVVCGALVVISMLGYLLITMGVLPYRSMLACFGLAAITLPIEEAAWGEAYASLDDRPAAILLAGSFVACAIVLFAVHLLPLLAAAILTLIQPIASTVLLLAVLSRSPYHTYVQTTLFGGDRPWPSWRMLVGVVALCAASFLLLGNSERVEGIVAVTTRAVVIAGIFVALALVIVAAVPSSDPGRRGCAVGVACAVGYAGIGLGNVGTFFSDAMAGLVMASFICVYLLAWVSMIDTARRTKTSPWLACMMSFAAVSIGMLAGDAVSLVKPSYQELAIVALLLIVIGVYFCATAARPEEVALKETDTLDARVDALADKYSLTPREHDVLREWARGHNASNIADTLSVSPSTVKTHIAHISQKTSTHGREELLKMLDETPGAQ